MDCFSALMRDRIIFIQDRIDENVASQVCAELLALQYEDPTADIRIFLNCTAGTQYCVTTILDMMDYISCDVSVLGMGCVAGPPAMLLAGATKGKRLSLPSTRIILSQPLGGLRHVLRGAHPGQGAEPQRALAGCVLQQVPRVSRSRRWESTWCATHMSPQEAMEINLIDGLIGVNDAKTSR